MKTYITFALASMMMSCAPVSSPEVTTSGSLHKKWELISLEGQEVTAETPVYLDFGKNGKVNGNTGCNTLNGTFSVTNATQIRFSQLAGTRMICAPYEMKIESDILEVLKTADNFTINDGKLMLNVGRRAPLAVFAEMSNNPVVNKYWTLKQINGRTVTAAPDQEKEQGFMLRSDGRITGFAGCNNFFGTYNLSGNTGISIDENLGMTMKACPDLNVDEQEFALLFKNAKNYEIKGNTLLLKDSYNKVIALFETM